MKTMLIVLFLVDGIPTIVYDGWAPIPVESMEVCEKRKKHLEEYFSTFDNNFHSVICK